MWVIALALVIGSASYLVHSATLIDSAVGELARNRSSAELILVVTSDCKVTGHKVYGSQLKRPNISFLARISSAEERLRANSPTALSINVAE